MCMRAQTKIFSRTIILAGSFVYQISENHEIIRKMKKPFRIALHFSAHPQHSPLIFANTKLRAFTVNFSGIKKLNMMSVDLATVFICDGKRKWLWFAKFQFNEKLKCMKVTVFLFLKWYIFYICIYLLHKENACVIHTAATGAKQLLAVFYSLDASILFWHSSRLTRWLQYRLLLLF